jgi:hypothetical protein
MASVLEELITRYGFVVGTPAVLEITGTVDINDTGQRTADLVFVRFSIELQAREADGTMVVSMNEKGREGHVSLSEARVRALRTLENTINKGGARRLDEYFDSLVDHK